MSYVNPVIQCSRGRFCGEQRDCDGRLARHRPAGGVSRYGAQPPQVLQTIANYCKLLHLYVAPATPPGLRTPRYHAGISRGYARMHPQASWAAAEQVGSIALPSGTPWMARPTEGKMSYVHPDIQCPRGRFCGEQRDCDGRLARHRPAGGVSWYGAQPPQVLQTITNYCKL